MTPAQREQLNRFLAETVMGWEVKSWRYLGCAYVRTTGSIWSYEWRPIASWSDCGQLLNKIERDGWVWCWDSYDRYTFEMMRDCASGPNENSRVFHASGETRTEALCLAIAKAYGGKEER